MNGRNEIQANSSAQIKTAPRATSHHLLAANLIEDGAKIRREGEPAQDVIFEAL